MAASWSTCSSSSSLLLGIEQKYIKSKVQSLSPLTYLLSPPVALIPKQQHSPNRIKLNTRNYCCTSKSLLYNRALVPPPLDDRGGGGSQELNESGGAVAQTISDKLVVAVDVDEGMI